MLDLLVWLLFIVIIMGLAVWIIQQLPIPPPFGSICIAIIGVICLILLVSVLMGVAPFRSFR
jgi:cytochrome c biogenesis factor